MARDSTATKARLLNAAVREFAQHGIAGARVDRIALAAESNKSLIYAYFGNKEKLFTAAFTEILTSWLYAIEFTPNDLPGYAGKTFDLVTSEPDILRMSLWFQLESDKAQVAPDLALTETSAANIAALAAAQEAGTVSSRYPADALMTMTQGLSMSWSVGLPRTDWSDPADTARRRELLISAVTDLVTSPTPK